MKAGRVDVRTLGRVTAVLVAAWLLIGIYVLHATLDQDSPVLPLERTIGIHRLLPQRWALFTIDPTVKYPLPFRREGARWEPIEPSYRGNQFGFDRAIIAPITEAYELTQALSDSDWSRCDRTPAECLPELSLIDVDNPSNVPRLCGEIGVVKRLVPSWNDRFDPAEETPFEIVRLRSSC